ncbi:MAG: hypothetical protein SCH39_07975 [Methanosarcinales archaeon]|nr:hypothetical protein [Methanosarcinales archaeon]
MNENGDELRIVIIMFLVAFAFLGGLLLLDFFISPQTGNIAGYPITMPGIAWLGVPIFLIIVMILYVKNR